MLTKNIFFQNFKVKSLKNKFRKKFVSLIKKEIKNEKNLLFSFTNKYQQSYNKSYMIKLQKKNPIINIIGIGGSILGSKAIYYFLRDKIKSKISFKDNLISFRKELNQKKKLNIIISKSGNTLETIINSNIEIRKKDKNIILTENTQSYIKNLAQKLRAEVIDHKNYIGGRYSVLSEVGMLPAELMGLNTIKFKRLNYLINNKKFMNLLCENVEKTLSLIKKKKLNSIILNYDEKSENLFLWYQQLISESLGKKSKGILPVISNMPKDNHSLLQLYLDGPKNNFFTFFYVYDKKSNFITNNIFSKKFDFLKGKKISDVIYVQKKATQNIFLKKNIPFRNFEIHNRSEEVLGELFCFFVLETILLGKALNVNPYDQPSVELIKKETRRIFLKKN
tara:strand:- start:880 stop:2058 length:1179 start_codon:yes stop_codon:yes gene_type:complete